MELESLLNAVELKQMGLFNTPTLSLLGFLLTLINHFRNLDEFWHFLCLYFTFYNSYLKIINSFWFKTLENI